MTRPARSAGTTMTDRVHSLTVALERDIRTDDIEPLIQAILMLRGVAKVKQHITDSATWMAEVRARQDLRERLWKALEDGDSK